MNFFSSSRESDKELFFGKDEMFILIEEHWIMAHIVHALGCFKSVSEARKNGFNYPIPLGYNEIIMNKKGKNRKTAYIFKEDKGILDEKEI
jgi:hypothetical protein